MNISSRSGGRVGGLYAHTLFDISVERQAETATKSELEALQDVFAKEKDFWELMCSPYFTPAYKTVLLQKVFSGRLSDLTLDFLMVTVKHNRIRFLPDIGACFAKLWDSYHGCLPVKVTISEKTADGWGAKFSDEMASILNRKINLEVAVAPSIIGGIIIRYADKVVDNSVRTRLQNLVTTVTGAEKRWIKQDEIRFE
jgi:F-type H+-transporting ATPase subunit delta